MKKLLSSLLILLVAAASLFAEQKAEEKTISEGAVVVVPLEGEVTKAQFFFLRRMLKEAEAEKASAFIIDMDTYGGSLQAAVDMLKALMETKVPTYTYVDSNAGSAGAMIALSTKHIYMAPVSAIGAAAPVSSGGQEIGETMTSKIVSYFSGYFRSAAEKNGYNPEVAEAFINKEKEVKIGDKVINPKGTLLTLSAQEAVKVYDGKPLLAQGIASSLEELCQQAGLNPGKIVKVEPSGFEMLAQWITALAPLFMLGGVIGAYMEFKTPGFGVAGVLAGICFLLFFAGHYVAGLTGFEVMAVFVLGVILVLLEVIFFPGIFVLVASGLVLMLGSLLFAMVDYYPERNFEFSPQVFFWPAVNLTIGFALSVIVITIMARFFPSLPLLRNLILAKNQPEGPSLPMDFVTAGHRVEVGSEGVARTILRPAGRAEFGGEYIDVVADGEFLEAGAKVRVLRVEGERVVVEAA